MEQPASVSLCISIIIMAAPEITIPVNDDEGLDSAYGEGDEASETHSLLSAVTNYVYENGRRYQSYRSESYW